LASSLCAFASLREILPEAAMDFQVPELGEGVYEAELVAWHVKPGDVVKRGQTLMEVMTDKATMEVPSRFAGRIGELRAEPGQQIKVGQVVLTYETDKETGRPEDKEAVRQGDRETGRQGDKETEGNGRAQPREESGSVMATPLRGSSLAAIK